jgi:hypothetical protein
MHMNSSRAMLLAASFFSATVFASENQNPPASTQTPPKTGMIAAVTGAVSGVVGTVAAYTLDPVSAYTFEPILTRLPWLSSNATFKAWTPAMSKMAVIVSAAMIARWAYNKSQADTVEDENDPFEVEIVEEYN